MVVLDQSFLAAALLPCKEKEDVAETAEPKSEDVADKPAEGDVPMAEAEKAEFKEAMAPILAM